MTATTKWSGLGYEQVPVLANRPIARYLRASRRTMTRFFRERGMLEFYERMIIIRRSRQGMMEKNRMFQEVLDDYARAVNPPPVPAPAVAGEANTQQGEGQGSVELRGVGSAGVGGDTGGGLQGLETSAGSSDESVIEE